MYLKSLEMVGFKSFAEKTRLDFEPGITAVVGPNGCGKSNVVDAIRWCLGEMSAKSLRSKALVDVIFNGSADRSASHFSEVTLTFDNSQNVLPVEYGEVMVTRRLFRSGESEYYLNKTQCRLRDVTDLFLDTGVGEEGYSIMEQGRVEHVLYARPEERRELFEEAAGVAKYKARRDESLRKLERAQLDLDRLSDVIALTKEQMDKIESAVKKARQYQKLQETYKSLEISHWLWDWNQLTGQMESMKQALEVMERDLQQKNTEQNQREAGVAELRWREVQQGEEWVEANRRLTEADGQLQLAEEREKIAREREQEIIERAGTLAAELAQGAERLAELKKLAETLESELAAERTGADALAAARSEAERDHQICQSALTERESKVRALQEKQWQNTQERTRLIDEISREKARASRAEAQLLYGTKAQSESGERKQYALLSRQTNEEALLACEKEQAALDLDIWSAQDALQKGAAELAALGTRTAGLQSELYKAQAELDAQEKWESSDVYASGARILLESGLPGLHGPLGRIIRVNGDHESIVRRALGPYLNDLIAETTYDAERALDHLSGQGGGRARIFILDRLPGRGEAAGAVSEQVQSDEKFRPVVRFLLGSWRAEGRRLTGEGVMEGGSDAALPPATDALHREKLNELIREKTRDISELDARRRESESAVQALTESRDRLLQRLEIERLKFTHLKQEGEKTASQFVLLEDQARIQEEELRNRQEEKHQAEEALGALEKQFADLSAEISALQDASGVLQQEVQSAQADMLRASSALAVARERAEGHQDRLRWKEKQFEDCRAELSGLANALELKSAERDASAGRTEEQRRIQRDARAAIDKAVLDRQGVVKDLEALQARRKACQEELETAQKNLAELRRQTGEIEQQYQDKRLQHSHTRFKLESIETQLKEKYQLTLEEAAAQRGAPAEAVAAAELEKIRRRLDSAGPVNLAAPEEHAQLEERSRFLAAQQADLVKAKEDLLATIQKINAGTRQGLRETFDKVRENFQQIYGQLFPGGVADVRLTDESDVLNAGVEIYAQPPGKKLQNITLLSGGEKALTALALLFAFFMVRPAPFAVLDEVDAPLDEANVTRFIALVQAFTQKSQFLIITHNKRTMETADALYGVTMESLGVSRVLSARLRVKDGNYRSESPESVIAGEAAAAN